MWFSKFSSLRVFRKKGFFMKKFRNPRIRTFRSKMITILKESVPGSGQKGRQKGVQEGKMDLEGGSGPSDWRYASPIWGTARPFCSMHNFADGVPGKLSKTSSENIKSHWKLAIYMKIWKWMAHSKIWLMGNDIGKPINWRSLVSLKRIFLE